jgi:hypothetical protein
MEDIMHNLISYNQLAGWNEKVYHLGKTLDDFNEQGNIINDYYSCLIECQDSSQICNRICRKILST